MPKLIRVGKNLKYTDGSINRIVFDYGVESFMTNTETSIQKGSDIIYKGLLSNLLDVNDVPYTNTTLDIFLGESNCNSTIELDEFIVKIRVTTSSTSHTVDYSMFGFTEVVAVVPVVVRNISGATQACFGIIKSFDNNQAVITVAESKTTGVLIGGSIEGLELVSGVVVDLIIIRK